MIPSENGSSRADIGEIGPQQIGHDNAAVLVQACAIERPAEQLELRELDRLVDPLEDLLHVGTGLEELGGEPQGLRGGVGVLEPPGVGDESDVERLGDLRRQRHTSAARMSRTISAVEDASGTTRFAAPNRVLSWW